MVNITESGKIMHYFSFIITKRLSVQINEDTIDGLVSIDFRFEKKKKSYFYLIKFPIYVGEKVKKRKRKGYFFNILPMKTDF